MRFIGSALLYTALALSANASAADPAALEALRTGDMRKLTVLAEPVAAPLVVFTHENGSPIALDHYAGQIVVLNFWATWCAPCRKEMPLLDVLQAEMGGDDLAVVTIATGRNPRPAMERFFADAGVTHLPLHSDPQQQLARSMGVLGLPVTVILDRQGREVGRLQGEADWAGEDARALLAALIAE
jgi:thiol-disulfide isomerase/thioredoxin